MGQAGRATHELASLILPGRQLAMADLTLKIDHALVAVSP